MHNVELRLPGMFHHHHNAAGWTGNPSVQLPSGLAPGNGTPKPQFGTPECFHLS